MRSAAQKPCLEVYKDLKSARLTLRRALLLALPSLCGAMLHVNHVRTYPRAVVPVVVTPRASVRADWLGDQLKQGPLAQRLLRELQLKPNRALSAIRDMQRSWMVDDGQPKSETTLAPDDPLDAAPSNASKSGRRADVRMAVAADFDPRGACWVRSRPPRMALLEVAEGELAAAMRSADPARIAPGFEGLPEVLSLKVSELTRAIDAAVRAEVDFTTVLVARRRLEELRAQLETAERIKRVNYQLGAATVRSSSSAKTYELAGLVQWMVYAVDAATAAQVH